MKVGYLFGGRYDTIALGGNAVDIREDLTGFEAGNHEVVFRPFMEAPVAVPGVIRGSKNRVPSGIWGATRDLALLRKDRAWQRRLLQDPALQDVDIAFEYWSPESFGGGEFARDRGLPHVLENLDPLTDERRAAQVGHLNRRAQARERRRRQGAAALIVMAKGMGEYLVSEWDVDPARVHWMPQGVNTTFFAPHPPEERAARRQALGINDGEHVIGFVGSLATYQRVDVLVDAARLLRERRDDTKLVLVGGSAERARALGAADLGVVVPHVDYEEVPSYIAAFDVAVLPDSNWYGSPIKVLEYAAVGTPVVAPDIGPVRDLVSGPDEAMLVPPSDAEALAQAITATFDDPGAAAKRASRFGAKVRAEFDRADRTGRVLDLCAQLVAEGPRA